MKTIKIDVPVRPMGKPRMTQRDRWKKRPTVERFHQWKDEMRKHLPDLPPAEKILDLSWRAELMPAKSLSKKKKAEMIGQLHRQKPDRDNIDKAILDLLFSEDQAIASGTIEKVWSERDHLTIYITMED